MVPKIKCSDIKILFLRYGDSFFTMRRIFSSVAAGFSNKYELEEVSRVSCCCKDIKFSFSVISECITYMTVAINYRPSSRMLI